MDVQDWTYKDTGTTYRLRLIDYGHYPGLHAHRVRIAKWLPEPDRHTWLYAETHAQDTSLTKLQAWRRFFLLSRHILYRRIAVTGAGPYQIIRRRT